ncbi:MAG: hypothetical protein RLZZ600_582 [Actinomycetota bacterium]
MGKHRGNTPALTHRQAVLRTHRATSGSHVFIRRGPGLLAAAFLAAVAVLWVNAVDPYSGAVADSSHQNFNIARYVEGQNLIAAEAEVAGGRDGVAGIVRLSPASGVPDAGTAQAIAYVLVIKKGWTGSDFDCLVNLWNRESHWNVNSHNASSGAHGIPQALPGNKMASAGPDWETNPRTQIIWGLGYIENRYGTPCGAWAHSEEFNWY